MQASPAAPGVQPAAPGAGAQPEPQAGAAASAPAAVPVSRDARRVYETSRAKLVQIRTLLRNTNTQSSVGSGFFVQGPGLIVTNFHVASQLALDPERHRGVFVPVDGTEGEVELLAFDVQHDLAVLRARGRRADPQAAFVLGHRRGPFEQLKARQEDALGNGEPTRFLSAA